MKGHLYGIGVGPGDPELITLKAVRLLSQVPVIAYPAPVDGESLARAIAASHIPDGRTEIVIRTPMIAESFPAHDVYDRYAREIVDHLEAGRNVAVLCEGDPFFYGSFMYLFARLAQDYVTEIVPGVSSLGGCTAAAALPLVSRNETLSVIPAPLAEDVLAERLARAEAVAIVKVGRHLSKVRRVIDKLGRMHEARYVERASMAGERVLPLRDAGEGPAPYFSMVLLPGAKGLTQ
jgi:precorrin-2/cobalt-factor-2 C20-methyltransferase